MNIQFSIIMPVYNGEDYLCASINSVIHQKYENFELILVDDGSKDNSSVICKKFELEDNRVRYYYKENSGISGARNYGMNLARGKYITFIDQDDLWDSEFLSVSQNIITNKMVDTVKVSINYYVHKQNKEKKISRFIYSSDCLITRQDIRSKYYILKNNGLFTFVWNTIFLRDIIVNNNIKFCEDLKFGGEDNVFNYSYLKHSQSIYTLKKPLYSHYRRINISQSTKISKNKIKSNEIFYTSETSFIDFMKIKETPSRISDYLLGHVHI